MADKTGIGWTDATWNPITGCDRVSPGCDHCYALTQAARLKAMGSPKYQRDGDPRTSGPGFGVTVHPDTLTQPLRWTRRRMIFVNSMSDLFHKDIPDEYIAQVFAIMALAQQHIFQVLTKRHARMRALLNDPRFTELVKAALLEMHASDPKLPIQYAHGLPLPNVWLGVSVENQQWAGIRVPALLDTPAAIRWLSCEPLLGSVDLTSSAREHMYYPDLPCWCGGMPAFGIPHRPLGLDWVVVGGESGPDARPMHPSWARSLRDQCQQAGVAFFMKQFGTWRPLRPGDPPNHAARLAHLPDNLTDPYLIRDGGHNADPALFPVDLQIQDYPEVG